jgi:hypothetical protein
MKMGLVIQKIGNVKTYDLLEVENFEKIMSFYTEDK